MLLARWGAWGSHVVWGVTGAANLSLVAAIDTAAEAQGEGIGSLVGLGALDVVVSRDPEGHLCLVSYQYPGAVMVDFTHPAVAV